MSKPGRNTYTWKNLREQILKGSDVCWLCGLPGADTIDHVLPLSIYPELAEDLSNLRPAHKSCNSKRGNGLSNVAVRPQSRRW